MYHSQRNRCVIGLYALGVEAPSNNLGTIPDLKP